MVVARVSVKSDVMRHSHLRPRVVGDCISACVIGLARAVQAGFRQRRYNIAETYQQWSEGRGPQLRAWPASEESCIGNNGNALWVQAAELRWLSMFRGFGARCCRGGDQITDRPLRFGVRQAGVPWRRRQERESRSRWSRTRS